MALVQPTVYNRYNEVRVRKKLSAIGNSYGLILEKPILELLAIDKDTELEMTTDGTRLIVEPIRARRRRIHGAARKVMDRHAKTLKKLAE